LILGGCGFIGRTLVEHLSNTKGAKKIRVADKVMPELAGLSVAQKAIFKSDLVDYKQANLNNPAHITKVFAEDFGKWDIVVNCASETKYSQSEQVYKENIVDLAQKNAVEAAKHAPKFWIELSTGQVYASDKKPRDEEAKTKPWTKMASAKLAAESAVQGVAGLNVVVLRLAIVYGPGDQTGIMPRLVCGATYTTGDEVMMFLWDKDLNIHTVHVVDVCRAIVHIANGKVKPSVYNLVDDNDTDQGKVCEHIEQLYGIKTSFMGGMKSKLATAVAMKTVADTANDQHLGPWSDLCKAKGINTPLTPYLDEELLYNNSLTLDGSKFAATGFKYEYPKMTTALLKQSIQYFIDNKAYPEGLLKV